MLAGSWRAETREGWVLSLSPSSLHPHGLGSGASLVAQRVKHPPAKWETWIRSLGWEDSPGEGNGNPLQYSYLENPTDRAAWEAAVYAGHKESDTTEQLHFTSLLHLSTIATYVEESSCFLISQFHGVLVMFCHFSTWDVNSFWWLLVRRKWKPTPVLLPGKFPWTEEHGKLQFVGLQRVGHD